MERTTSRAFVLPGHCDFGFCPLSLCVQLEGEVLPLRGGNVGYPQTIQDKGKLFWHGCRKDGFCLALNLLHYIIVFDRADCLK